VTPTSKAGFEGKLRVELSMPKEATVVKEKAVEERPGPDEEYRYVTREVYTLAIDGECVITKQGALPITPLSSLIVIVDTEPKLVTYKHPTAQLNTRIPITIRYSWEERPEPFTLTTIVKAVLKGPVLVAAGEAKATTEVRVS